MCCKKEKAVFPLWLSTEKRFLDFVHALSIAAQLLIPHILG